MGSAVDRLKQLRGQTTSEPTSGSGSAVDKLAELRKKRENQTERGSGVYPGSFSSTQEKEQEKGSFWDSVLDSLAVVGKSGDSTQPLNNATVVANELRSRPEEVQSLMENRDAIEAERQKNAQAMYDWADKRPWAASAASILTSPLSGVDMLQQLVEVSAIGHSLPHENVLPGEATQILREGASADMGKVGKLLYNTAMAGIDSYVGSMLGGGVPGVGGFILAGGAASNAMNDIKRRGGSDSQAVVGGIAAGVIEGLFETLSIGQLDVMKEMPVDGAKTLLKNIVKGVVTNASEEAATETANILFDTVFMGDLSTYAQMVSDAMASGMTEAEAKKFVKGQLTAQVGQSALSGALMGAGMTTVASAQSALANKANQKTTAAPQTNATQQAPTIEQKPTQESAPVQPGVVSPTMQESAQSVTVADSARVENVGQTAKNFSVPGLVRDANFKKANLSSKMTRELDAVGKVAGVEVRFAPEVVVDGKKGNAKYENGVITIALDAQDPVRTAFTHEIVHRIKEASPEVYDTLASFVSGHMQRGSLEALGEFYSEVYETDDVNAWTEEMVADAFGTMLSDSTVMEQFVQDNRTAAQKVRDAIHDFIAAIKRMLNGQNVRLNQEEQSIFAELQTDLEGMEKVLSDALTAIEGNKNAATVGGETKYSLMGTTADGVEVYETSDDVKQLPYKERVNKFLELMRGEYAGRTAKFIRDGEVLYAKFDEKDLSKNIYGDKRSDKYGWKAKINTGADGSIFELVENSAYSGGKPEAGKQTTAHKGVTGWEYYAKTVQIDGRVFDVLANVRKKNEGEYVYSIQLNESKTKSASPVAVFAKSNPASKLGETDLVDSILDFPENSNPQLSRIIAPEERTEVAKRMAELNKQYGTIRMGENPARDIQVPKRTAKDNKVSQTIRTVLEAGATPDEALPTIEKMIADGDFSYEVYGDKQAIKDAENFVKHRGWGDATREWFDRMKKGEVSKKNTAIGWTLYNNAVNSKDMETAIDILNAMVEHQRNAAQAVQATRILKKMSPEGQLYAAQKSVQRLQEELNERYGKKPDVELKIDPALAEELMEAEDQKARDKVLQKIYKDIGRQIPSRFIDKWNAWRYLAMLGNPRTHVRNIVGNAFFAPVVATKNLTATAIESAVNRVTGGKTGRTKAVVGFGTEDKGRLKAAWADYADVAEAAMDGGKYSDSANANKYIQEGRQIFGRTDQAKNKFSRAVSGTVGKGVEAARTFNSKALEVEDRWFSQPHYAAALASYCKANGITAEQMKNGGITDEARAYAIKEAQKATYRDTNMLSDIFGRIGRYEGKNKMGKAISTAVEGILPFRKTPANILARGLEYSPIGLLKSISYDLVQVKNGDMNATQLIDNLSAGLTGTGLLALGAFLAAQGLVRGAGGDDKDKKEFEDLMGHQNYALEIGGKSYTLDWLAPEALPFFVGVNLWEVGEESKDGRTLADWLTAISNVSEPMMEMSCLQSLNDVFDSVGYASSNGLSGLTSAVASAATSYLTQGIPTLLGQFERSAQDIRMTTYTDKNKKNLTGDMQYAIGSASGKIPIWDYSQIAYIDAWGRTESTGSPLSRVLNNMANPSYVSAVDESKMEKELMRLYNSTSDPSVFPNRASKYFSVGGKRIDLNGAQYVSYAKKKGQTAYNLLADLTKSSAYAKLTDTDKAKAVGLVYDYANAVAKAHVSKYELEGWIRKADKSRDVVSYILKEKVGK